MLKSIVPIAIITAAIPAVALAATPRAVKPNAANTRPLHAPRAHATPQLSASLSAASLDAARSQPAARRTFVETETTMPTSLDHGFDRRGALVGTLGYHHASYANHLDAQEVDAAAANQFGAPDSTLGVNLTFHFH